MLFVIYGEYIEKTPISVDEKFQKNRRSKSFSFIFSGKSPDKKILKVTKNRIEKKSSSMLKLKSKKGGANLPHPRRDRVKYIGCIEVGQIPCERTPFET